MRKAWVCVLFLLQGCEQRAAMPPKMADAAGVSGTAPACRGQGRYESGKEGSYRPCCPGLNEVFYASRGYTNDAPACSWPPLRVYACVKGECGDGICEPGEAPACGCVADCPGAAWGPQAPTTPGTQYGPKVSGKVRFDGQEVELTGTAAAVVRDGLAHLFMIPDPSTRDILTRAVVSIALPGQTWQPGTVTGVTPGIVGGVAFTARDRQSYSLLLPAGAPEQLTLRIDRAVRSDDGSHYYLTGRLTASVPPTRGGGSALEIDLVINVPSP